MVKALTLYELNSLVSETIALSMPGEYWVEAELSEVREVRGNCYLELVQKDLLSPTPIAKASAKCWRNVWPGVRREFERVTGQTVRTGLKVMLKVYADFHAAYGFSWIVTGINPEYTLGDMARRRLEIIRQLKAEGVFDMQKELHVPMFARRVAVVSASGAAGYGDFCNQLADNDGGFSFDVELFEAVMQGEAVEKSVIAALDRIYARSDEFDVVVIIRGGGATSDLSGFDTLALAENVANFPLPVITGIGHDRDESILDMVSNTRVKTPTAAAAFLVDNLEAVARRIDTAAKALADTATGRMATERERIERLAASVPSLVAVRRTRCEALLDALAVRMSSCAVRLVDSRRQQLDTAMTALAGSARQVLTAGRHRLELLQQRASSVDPHRMLARGYSLTLHDGRAVRDPMTLKKGERIVTLVEKGRIESAVENVKSEKQQTI